MDQPGIRAGCRVRVSNPHSPHFGRTGHVEALVSYVGGAGGPFGGPPESRGWSVLFDWPLGGMGSYAEVSEEDLELLLNIPNKGETPP